MKQHSLSDKNLCVSIANSSFDECVEIVKNNALVELRLDLLSLSDKEYEYLLKLNTQYIVTCRYSEDKHPNAIDTLKKVILLGADYVDIEWHLNTPYFNEILKLAKSKNCKVIVSYHNFEATPSVTEMQNIIDTAKNKGADYVKIATEVKTQKDSIKLLSLYEHNDKLIAFGMGELGRISRVSSLYMGADFTYVSIDENNKTASGQLTTDEMKTIFKLI